MMKRSFSTVACLDLGCGEVIAAALRHNMQGIELRMDNDNGIFGVFDKEELALMGQKIRSAGLVITDVGTSVGFMGYDASRIDTAKACMERTAAVGGGAVRIFLGSFARLYTERKPSDYEGIVRVLRELCDYGESINVEIWIETHNDFSEGRVLSELIADTNRKNLRVIWDIIHPYEAGEQPEDTLRLLGNRIAHVHIKDGRPYEDKNRVSYLYTVLGEGILPISNIVKLLERELPDIFLSLEWEREWRQEILNAYANIDEILEAYVRFTEQI